MRGLVGDQIVGYGRPLTGPRRVLAISALSLGGFAIGASEFLAMGLLPEIAAEAGRGIEGAAAFVWSYALGVVLGAPVAGVLSTRFSQGRFLTASLLAMGLLTGLMATAPGFGVIIALRIAAALPHAAYFGVGGIAAARILGKHHAARGVAVVLGGLAVANVLGTPLGTRFGQLFGWRPVYLVVVGMFVLAACGVGASLSRLRRPMTPLAPRTLIDAFANAELWRNILVFAMFNSGLFALVSFTAPLVTDLAGASDVAIPVALVASGAGMTVGNYVGGVVTDRSHRLAGVVLVAVSVAAFVGLLFTSAGIVAVYVALFFAGYGIGAVSPLSQVRLMRSVPIHSQIGSSMNSLAGNFGSVIGTVSATITLGAGTGIMGIVWVGLALSVPGWVGLWSVLRRR